MSYQHRIECEQLRYKLNAALKRAEAAEAKLAELEKQEPFEPEPVAILGQQLRGYDKPTFICELLIDEHNGEVEAGSQLFAEPFTRPAPAVSLAEMVPDGWKLVPVEPTLEMLDSQEHEMLPMVHHDSMRERARMIRRHGWRVMLAAAPEVE